MNTPRAYNALTWAMGEMPTGADQKALAATYHAMDASNEPELVIVRAMATAVVDGLAYGNWPGTFTTKSPQ